MKGNNMFEKPKRKKIKWHGQDITMPFNCSVYNDKTVKIKNRFTGEETEMPGYAASVYDTIIGAEKFLPFNLCYHGRNPPWISQGLKPVVLSSFNSRVTCVVALQCITA